MNLKYKVLCIGVNKVPGLRRLNYAEKDAYSVSKYFETLKNKADATLLNGKNATRINILNWVKECSTVQEELTVIIFFAGHGSAEKNEKTKSLERCLWIDGNSNVPFDSHQLKTSEVLKLLNNPLHKLIFLIDACYDFDPRQKVSIRAIFNQFKESERMTLLKQYVIISASAVNTVAFEDPQVGHGVLTYYFLQTMAGKYTFFLRKKIAFFKFLATLDKKVRNHRFLTDTGRKHPRKELMRNGIMVHYSDENFQLPVLEPIPLIPDPQKKPFQHKLSQWTHFFTCTRLRTKILLAVGLLAAVLLLVFLAHISVVRIHFKPLLYTTFHDSLFGSPGVYLQGIESNRIGKDYDKKLSLYLFKHNWINALLRQLDEKGKLILKGYLLGDRINELSELLMVGAAFSDSDGVFYWHPDDVMKLLTLIRWGYMFLDKKEKQAALKLLAKLGKYGKTTAAGVFDFKRETHQELRDLFLEHFYSIDLWEKNVDYFNFYDYLCLIKSKKQAPFSKNVRLREKVEFFLRSVVRSLSDSNISITDTNKLPEIYQKLGILAFFGSAHFQKKASDVFKKAFDANEVLDLVFICKNFRDIVWLLEQYFKHMQGTGIPDNHWWKLIYDFFKKLPVKEKSRMIRFFFNTKFQLLPEVFWNGIFRVFEDCDPNIIRLSDWESWMKKYQIPPYYVLDSITQMRYALIFPFIETHYDYFKGEFSVYTFEDLHKMDSHRTLTLVKKLYPISSPRDKLCCAIFLYSKNYKEHSIHIINFLREARNNKDKQNILRRFYWWFTKILIRMVETNGISRDELRFLMSERELFYTFVELNLRLWPGKVKRILLRSKIPYRDDKGIPLLRACEKLPDPERKRMLVKICLSDIDETFRLNAESSLIHHYPKEFLKLAYKQKYYNHWAKKHYLVQAYQRFSFKELKQELILNLKYLKEGINIKIDFICEALTKKEAKGELNIQDLQHILKEFNRPVERILLRKLRHHVHKRYFQDGEKDE
jgi:hypothetical protein